MSNTNNSKPANWLDIILAEGEGYYTEFKEAISKIDKELVAFANSSGGKIYLGISDDSKIKGFKLSNKLKSEIQSIAENCDPPIRIIIENTDNIAIIHIPEGNRKPYKCSTGFYIRNGATSQKMTTDDIIDFIHNEGRIRFDEITDKRFHFESDFDMAKYNQFIKKCNISEDYSYIDVLTNLGLLTAEDNIYMLNNAGILFFSKNPTKYFPQSVVTGVLYKGTDKTYILDRKDFNSDLISNIEDAILFLKKHLNLRYKIEKLQRENILELPEDALREALVNSFVHRDYFEKGANILIEIFDDRVEITNPGGLAKGLKESELGTKSITRNPLIASIMLRANYIEKLGTGIKRIQNSLRMIDLEPAVFDIGLFFTIKLLRPSAIKVNKIDAGLQDNNTNTIQKTIQKTVQKTSGEILELIFKNPNITQKEIAESIGRISIPGVKYQLNKLKSEGMIRRVGPDKGGHWEIIGE